MNKNSKLLDDRSMRTIALALQGMAFWHLLLGLAALALTVSVAVARPDDVSDNFWGVGALSGAEVTGGALAAALMLGGLAWWMLGRGFWRPQWSVILMPGLAGTLAMQLFELMDWPVSFLIGGAVAYFLVARWQRVTPARDF
jgi:hypothetical protein